MLGQQNVRLEDIFPFLHPQEAPGSSCLPQTIDLSDVTLIQDDETESTQLSAEISVANFGLMSQPDDFITLSVQSILQDDMRTVAVYEDITPIEEPPENVNMAEYMAGFQQELYNRAEIIQPPFETVFTFPETPPNNDTRLANQTSAQIPHPRPFSTRTCLDRVSTCTAMDANQPRSQRSRLGGVSTYPTEQPRLKRSRLGGLSDDPDPHCLLSYVRSGSREASCVGLEPQINELPDAPEDIDVFGDDEITSGMNPGLDPRLREAFRRCQGTRTLEPLLKEELRLKILTRRLGNGQEDIQVDFKEPPPQELTEKDHQKRAVRRAQNRGAAQRFREKKKTRETQLKQTIEKITAMNAELRREAETLREETTSLRSILDLHLASGECRLQQDGHFSCWPDMPSSLCQQILRAEEVDGRFAISP